MLIPHKNIIKKLSNGKKRNVSNEFSVNLVIFKLTLWRKLQYYNTLHILAESLTKFVFIVLYTNIRRRLECLRQISSQIHFKSLINWINEYQVSNIEVYQKVGEFPK